jgi:succinyl-CoA synthetase beta subunit
MKGSVAYNKEDALTVAKQFGEGHGHHEFVIKAQVLGGGRGMGYFKENNFKGGVHLCKTAQEVKIKIDILGRRFC